MGRGSWPLQTRNFESVERDDDAAVEGGLRDFRILGGGGLEAAPRAVQLQLGTVYMEGVGDSDGGRDRYSSAHEDM